MPVMKDGLFDLGSFDSKPVQQQQPKKKQGGLSTLIGGIARSVVDPFINTGKALSYVPAAIGREVQNKPITDIQKKAFGTANEGDIARKIVGNTAQVGLTLAAPGANTVKKAAVVSAATGAGSALTREGSTLGDVLTGGLVGGATGGAFGAAGKVLSKALGKGGNSFLDNLTTQGQQMQGRGLGISGGNKVAGKELAPQDTERMLGTLKAEGIKVGNANSTARDLNTKLQGYGKQIADHFKTNNSPLKPDDTKVIADNFMSNLKTTDPRVLKEAQILADDLQKNVKSTKDLWEFRKSLDDRIPDSKQTTGVTLSNQMRSIKDMRQYIAKELGDVPGMQSYHDLSEIKPFLGKGMRELNQPSGSIVSRVLSSGPIQKAEAVAGKGLEKVGGAERVGAVPSEPNNAPIKNFTSGILRQGTAATTGGAMVPSQAGQPSEGSIDQTKNGTTGDALGSVGSDVLGFGGGDTSNDPFDPNNVQSSVQSILAQGGDMKDVAAYLSNVETLQKLKGSSGGRKALNSAASGVIADTKTGLSSLASLKDQINSSSANNPLIGRIRGSNPLDTGAQSLQASIATTKQIVGKALEGGVLRKEDEAKYAKLLPTMGDTDATASSKIDSLINLISGRLNEYQSNISGGSGGTDLSSLGL